jgi:hypothetical protein
MNEPLGYSRDGDVVTLRMTSDDYAAVLLGLGALASVIGQSGGDPLRIFAAADRLSVGNPNYTPYEIPDV